MARATDNKKMQEIHAIGSEIIDVTGRAKTTDGFPFYELCCYSLAELKVDASPILNSFFLKYPCVDFEPPR